MKKLYINSDGASRGNPGHSGYGFIIKDENGIILHQEHGYLGIATNNEAEYHAVLKSLEYVKKYLLTKGPLIIDFHLDSELVANQLNGLYRVKQKHLLELYRKIKSYEKEIGTVNYIHVSRNENIIADRLANQALDLANQSST